ncbi:MAG TPA: hypothetical protein VFO32_06670 [Sphingomicrobium sp.]|jgi:hypothetical protein|nr:hypothetical protein [Sphingomicrobium sp.]
MIDLMLTLGVAAESKTLPSRGFDDSQDCLTFLRRQMEGFARLRINPRRPGGGGPLAPWRSL